MKTSLDHLDDERKRMELETIVRMIRKAINVEMIIQKEFLKVFPKGTQKERDRFNLLKIFFAARWNLA